MQNSKCKIQNWLLAFCIFNFAFCIASCSIPKIEDSQCASARDVVKRYYSLAIGGDLEHQPDALRSMNALLAPDFNAEPIPAGSDRFYFSSVQPTSNRVDECAVGQDGKVTIDATVIWRLNEKNYTRKDRVTLVKSNDSFLVERIDVGPQPNF